MFELELLDEEWAILVDLLENEARELPTEIRHAGLAEMKDRLRHRRDMVEQLLSRLKQQADRPSGSS